MNHVGHEAALHALPALLDGDVAGPHQGKDVPGQLGKGVLHVDGVAGRRLHVAHPVRSGQLLCFLTGHLQDGITGDESFPQGEGTVPGTVPGTMRQVSVHLFL